MDRAKLHQKIEENFQQEVEALQGLLQFESVVGEPVRTKEGELYPFGLGVQQALEYTLKLGKNLGFETANVDNYGGHIDFGKGKEIVGAIGHLDVVPTDDGWAFAPYSGAVSDGYIFGRGTTDDKGPTIAVLFAMKALQDLGYEPYRKIRLILGCDEEVGMEGLAYYQEKVPDPDFGFTPDGEFPVINGEKGIAGFDLVKKLDLRKSDGLTLRKLSGGSASNMVPELARAVVNSTEKGAYDLIRQKAETFREETGYDLKIKGTGKSLEILATGKAAHGASPSLGLNAISILMAFLSRLNFADEDVNEFVDFYQKHIGFDLYGERLGCQMADEESGPLTVNVGVAKLEKKTLSLTINIRFPVTKIDEDVYGGVIPIADGYNLGVVKEHGKVAIYQKPDAPMVQACMDIYRENTGDTASEPIVMGGGTYASHFDNMVAFGALFPGDEDLMHQRDEKLELKQFLLATKIYADALLKFSSEDFHL